MKLRLSILTSAFLIAGLFFLTTTHSGYTQENLSLGCCISPENEGTCEGCGDGGLKCAIDGSLCPETSNFTLGQVCAKSPIAGEAECYDVQTSGCCVNSKDKCADDVNFDTCTGRHWFEGAACTEVPQCAASSKDSLSLLQLLLIALAIVIVFSAIREYRKNKSRAK